MKYLVPFLAVFALAACGDRKVEPEKPAAVARDPLTVTVAPELAARLVLGAPAQAEVRETLRVPGRVEADENRMARVGSPVTGRITDLQAAVGQDVQRGRVLATINSTELSSAQLAYLRALSVRQLAVRGASRAQQLFDADVIGAAELQRRQSELSMAEAEASAFADQLKVLGMSAAAIARLSETRSINSLSQVVASISGTVIERKVTEGQVVQPADPVFVVADLSSVWVVADIPEQSAGSVRVGESVTVEIAALPARPVTGKLTFVSPVVNPETRTVRARLDLANPKRELKPDMLASVLIQSKPVVRTVLPATALVREENRDYVFVKAADGTYRLRPVELGPEHDGKRVLIGGVGPNDTVVIDGAFHLNNERRRQVLGSGQ